MIQKAIIITAPSGAGKTTLAQHLLHVFPNLRYSVSATTRAKRPGENDGIDYYYLDIGTFKNKIAQNAFIEYEQVYDNLFYGTLISEVERLWKDGFAILFVVDVQGALHLHQYFGEKALSIFIKAPTLDILAQRLRNRATEKGDILEQRIIKATAEMQYECRFDKVLVNGKLEDAMKECDDMVKLFLNA